jgi:hypothetical protein
MLPSNTGMQRTALGTRKIAAFLKVRTSWIPRTDLLVRRR